MVKNEYYYRINIKHENIKDADIKNCMYYVFNDRINIKKSWSKENQDRWQVLQKYICLSI